jgi:FAD/FMN-containing dehydrogenase
MSIVAYLFDTSVTTLCILNIVLVVVYLTWDKVCIRLIADSLHHGHYKTETDSSTGKTTIWNWAENQQFTPSELVTPHSLQELQDVLKKNYSSVEKKKVRAFGSLHSFSECFNCDNGIAIDMKKLNKILDINVTGRSIKAEGGIDLRSIYTELKKYGLAIATMPNVDSITLAGAVLNGTHGTNIEHGSFCDLVLEMEFIDCQGECTTLRKDSTDEQERRLFDAVLVSFGSLGIVYSITMECVPEYNMILYKEVVPFDDFVKNVTHIARKYTSVAAGITPYHKTAFVKTQTRLDPLGMNCIVRREYPEGITKEQYIRRKISHYLIDLLPGWLVHVYNIYSGMFQIFPSILISSWDTAEILPYTKKFFNMEYAIPEKNISEAIRFVDGLITRYGTADGGYIRTMLYFVRAVGCGSRGYLSSSRRADGKPTYYIDMPYQGKGKLSEQQIQFYKELESGLLALDGRVSFSRLFWERKNALCNYPDRDLFVAVKKEIDPENVFTNTFTQQLFEL